MKFNVFPNYKVPIEYLYYDTNGLRHSDIVGWVSTPNIEVLKKDHDQHMELVKR